MRMDAMDFPLKGWPSSVIPVLLREVTDFVEESEIEWFYIGRTDNLAATQSRHGCHDILDLYQTDSVENAMDVEDALIKAFHNHPKSTNDAKHSGGGTQEYYINYVYVAIWTRETDEEP
jgi:hypothetical protein